jgi:hypothetical protein
MCGGDLGGDRAMVSKAFGAGPKSFLEGPGNGNGNNEVFAFPDGAGAGDRLKLACVGVVPK